MKVEDYPIKYRSTFFEVPGAKHDKTWKGLCKLHSCISRQGSIDRTEYRKMILQIYENLLKREEIICEAYARARYVKDYIIINWKTFYNSFK